ncbi:MAG: non-homologous end-joining DNA ligase [Methanocellales archaeon]
MREQKILPMLAMLTPKPFNSAQHLFEIKWDGTRTICFTSEPQRLQNRRLVDITKRYPEIKVEIKKKSAILDGEIIIMQRGKPDFQKLQLREHLSDPFKIELLSKLFPAEYIVFDVLAIDGSDVTTKPLMKRKEILRDILIENEHVTLCDFILENGIEYYNAAIARGLEGIMAKDIYSPYLTGKRSNFWLKIKQFKTLDCIICGLTEGEGLRKNYFGSLILGVYIKERLHFIGKVGTGFDEVQLKFLEEQLKPLKAPCPFEVPPDVEAKVKSWLLPKVVCEVKYQDLTRELKLRAPVFIRLRNDKAPEECTIEV